MQGPRPRLFFDEVAPANWKRIFICEGRQSRSFVLMEFLFLTPHLAPSRTLDDCSVHFERNAGTLQPDGGDVFHTWSRECLDHTPGNHVVHLFLLRSKFTGGMAGNKHCVVVGHFLIIHRAATQLRSGQGCRMSAEGRMFPQRGQKSRQFVEYILRNIAAARAGIGNQFRLVERLRGVERPLC